MATKKADTDNTDAPTGDTKGDTTTNVGGRDLLADQRADNGGLIDPPVIPEYERRINAAANAADADELEAVHREYDEAREERALTLAKRREANR
jgi:hypothetical protein